QFRVGAAVSIHGDERSAPQPQFSTSWRWRGATMDAPRSAAANHGAAPHSPRSAQQLVETCSPAPWAGGLGEKRGEPYPCARETPIRCSPRWIASSTKGGSHEEVSPQGGAQAIPTAVQ